MNHPSHPPSDEREAMNHPSHPPSDEREAMNGAADKPQAPEIFFKRSKKNLDY
jgi:hypothetical protein